MKRYALLLLLAVVCFAGCKEAQRWLIAYGYNPVTPPTTLLQPGALIMKKKFSNAGTRLVCSAADSLGPDFAPTNSKTVSGKFARSKHAGFHVGADVLSEVHASVNSDAIDDIFVQIDNAVVVNLTDSDVLRAVSNRSAACQAAIRRRKLAGYEISIIRSALIADCSYKVSYKKDVDIDASVKLAQVQQVAVTLGGNIQMISEDSASATGLVWGVQDSKYLAAIGLDDVDVRSLSVLKDSKKSAMLGSSEVLTAATNSRTLTPILTPLSEENQAYEVDDAPLWCPSQDAEHIETALPPNQDEAPAVDEDATSEPAQPLPERPAGARSPPSFRGRPAVGNGNH